MEREETGVLVERKKNTAKLMGFRQRKACVSAYSERLRGLRVERGLEKQGETVRATRGARKGPSAGETRRRRRAGAEMKG